MHYNPEISLGTILEVISIVGAVLAASIKFGKLEQKVNTMYKWFENTVLEGRHSQSKTAGE